LAGGEGGEIEGADTHPDEPQGWVADGGGHAADLAVSAFDEFEGDPAIGDGLTHPDGRGPWGDVRLRFQEPGTAWEGRAALDDDTLAELVDGFGVGYSFDLDPVPAGMGMSGLEQSLIPMGFIAEEEETLGIGVQSSDGVDAGRELEFGEGPVR